MEDLKEKVLQDISQWWEQTNKYGPKRPYWRIFHSNTKASKGKKAQENTEIVDLDNSFEFFMDSLGGMMQYLEKYISVSLYTNKTDAAPVQMTFVNPMYIENASSISGINGIGSTSSGSQVINTGYSKQDVDKMVQERLDAYKQLHEQQLESIRKEFEYKKMLEDMQNQIEGISESQKNTFDKIMGIAEHPVVSQVLIGLLGNFMPKTSPVSGAENMSNESEIDYEGESLSDDDEKINKSLESLEKVFKNETADVLEELSKLAEKNPDVLKQLRSSLQNMI